jgi:hypothetical protein
LSGFSYALSVSMELSSSSLYCKHSHTHYMYLPFVSERSHELVCSVVLHIADCFWCDSFTYVICIHIFVICVILALEFTLVPVWGCHINIRVSELDSLCLVARHHDCCFPLFIV